MRIGAKATDRRTDADEFRPWCFPKSRLTFRFSRVQRITENSFLLFYINLKMSTQEATDEQNASKQQNTNAVGLGSPLVKLPAAPVFTTARPVATQQSLAPSSASKPFIDHPLADIQSDAGAAVVVGKQIQSPRSPPITTTATPTPAAADITRAELASLPQQSIPAVQTIVSPSHTISMSLDDMADNFLSGPSTRTEQGLPPLLHPEPLPTHLSDFERLKLLIKQRSWGDACLLTEQLLRGQSSHYAPIYNALLTNSFNNNQQLPTLDSQQDEVVLIMMIQCETWIRLNRFTELGIEMERWSFCHHNDNTAPTWIPWRLHIMAAASLLYTCNDSTEALDALWKLSDDIPQQDPISKLHVEHALANAFTRVKEWRMALSCHERMLEILPEACRQHIQIISSSSSFAEKTNPLTEDTMIAALQSAYKCELLSRQGRIFLQLGATREARGLFDMAQAAGNDGPITDEMMQWMNHSIVPFVSAHLSLNDGLLLFAEGRYDEAMECFRRAIQTIHERAETRKASAKEHDMVSLIPTLTGAAPEDILYSETINNMSICALYTCNLYEAMLLMESLIRENPSKFLTERVSLNLCILYELSNETSMATKKKKVLQLIAKRFMLHDVGPSSFRL